MEDKAEDLKKETAPDKQTALFNLIEKLATNPNVSGDVIQQVIDMQKQGFDRDAEQAFNEAMCQAQNKIELVVAKKKNDQTHSVYADLKTILIQTKQIYTAEGFSLMFYEGKTEKEGHVRVACDIMHSGGHTKQRFVDMAIQTTGIAGKAMMTLVHAQGSAISYGRRYLICMIFNIPTGEDDDGNAAGNDTIDDEQIKYINEEIKKKAVDEKRFLAYLSVASVEKINLSDFGKATKALNKKEKPKV